jgi:hypothetical protein
VLVEKTVLQNEPNKYLKTLLAPRSRDSNGAVLVFFNKLLENIRLPRAIAELIHMRAEPLRDIPPQVADGRPRRKLHVPLSLTRAPANQNHG